MGRRLGVVVVVEMACTLSKCVTRYLSASCWMVAAEVGSASVANGVGGATAVGSMVGKVLPSLQAAVWLHLHLVGLKSSIPSTVYQAQHKGRALHTTLSLAFASAAVVYRHQGFDDVSLISALPFLKLLQACPGHFQLVPSAQADQRLLLPQTQTKCGQHEASLHTGRKHSMQQLHH